MSASNAARPNEANGPGPVPITKQGEKSKSRRLGGKPPVSPDARVEHSQRNLSTLWPAVAYTGKQCGPNQRRAKLDNRSINSAGRSENLKSELTPLPRALTAQCFAGSNLFHAPGAARRWARFVNKSLADKPPEPDIIHQPQHHENRNHV